uniref:Uncharacterized protein n=1 Tax=Rhizophora mucronata TaxID=61149 RepID=A0A2P2Q364_RHIMU
MLLHHSAIRQLPYDVEIPVGFHFLGFPSNFGPTFSQSHSQEWEQNQATPF